MTQRQRARCKTPAKPNQQTASRTQVRTMTHFWDVSHAWSPTPVQSASTGAAAGFSHSVRVRRCAGAKRGVLPPSFNQVLTKGSPGGLRTGKESLVGREKVLIQRPVVDRDQNWAVRLVRDEEEDGVAPAQHSGASVRRRSPASPEPSASGGPWGPHPIQRNGATAMENSEGDAFSACHVVRRSPGISVGACRRGESSVRCKKENSPPAMPAVSSVSAQQPL